MKKYVVVLALVLAGCSAGHNPTRFAVLKNPETAQFVDCRVDPWGAADHDKQITNCIKAYRAAGFELISDTGPVNPR